MNQGGHVGADGGGASCAGAVSWSGGSESGALGRRGLFGGALSVGVGRAAAAVMAAGAAVAAMASARTARAGPLSVSADVDPGALGVKLVNRITFGENAEEMALFSVLGYQGYLEHHLNHTAIDDSAVEARLSGQVAGIPPLNTIGFNGEQMYQVFPPELPVDELIEATIMRAVYSKRQLFERMVEFWSDHFSIDILHDWGWVLKPIDDRTVIRAHALGNFRDLLRASMQSPAMMNYLNNDASFAGNLNENYSRELMELHTLGVDSGYTQADVVAVARCLTGWTRHNEFAEPASVRGTFWYDHARHDTGQKVLSPLFNLNGSGPLVIPADQPPLADGLMIVDILASHPATARFVCTKLAKRFIGEDVPRQVIDAATATFLNNGQGVTGDIKAVLRTLLSPNVLADASAKFKRPFHLMVSALRALPVSVTSVGAMRALLDVAGHVPFFWAPPNGYPDTFAYWSGSPLPRWRFGASLLTAADGTAGGLAGISVDTGALLAGAPTPLTAEWVVNRIDELLFRGGLPAAERTRLTAFLNGAGGIGEADALDAFGIAIGGPAFQFV